MLHCSDLGNRTTITLLSVRICPFSKENNLSQLGLQSSYDGVALRIPTHGESWLPGLGNRFVGVRKGLHPLLRTVRGIDGDWPTSKASLINSFRRLD